MNSILILSDVVLDPVVKEIKLLYPGEAAIDAYYEEDIITRLLNINELDPGKYNFLFIHSDQVFHQKDQLWQQTYYNAVAGISKSFTGNILVSNACSRSWKATPLKLSLGNVFDTGAIYNDGFTRLTAQPNVYVFDFMDLCMSLGTQSLYNYNLGHLYQMPYTKPAIKLIAGHLMSQVSFLAHEEKKVIIVDCDNTLWKGVVGEDGADGICCDNNAEGILHYQLQLFLKARKEEGFLLCICSKNNEADVKEVFDKKNLPLKWNDFVIKKINWDDKINNIIDTGKELNLGIDSFIFIDDNLFELNTVKEILTGVSCIHLTDNYVDLLHNMNSFLFRKRQILKEDMEKTAQYELEKLRKNEAHDFIDLDEFIANLDISLDIRINDTNDFPRLAQMTGKTNQFNFNKHPYNEDELAAFTEKGRIYSLKVSDKYGDYGTVGIILIAINDKTAVMENYLVSCRALGKKIEYTFFDHVVAGLGAEGIELQDIRFKENDKNLPAQKFLKSINYGNKVK